MAERVIRVVDVTRTRHVGDVDVHALRGVPRKVARLDPIEALRFE